MSGLEILAIAGAGLSGISAIQGGRLQAAAAEQEAAMTRHVQKQQEIEANRIFAESQDRSKERERQRDLALSALVNRAAASGFETASPDVRKLEEGIYEQGTLGLQKELAIGSAGQQRMREQAALTGLSARSLENAAPRLRTAGFLNAGSGFLQDVSTMYSRFGDG
jgi:hypothetical protein